MSPKGERELICRGAKFDIERLSWVGAGGRVIRREVIRHPGAVCILPILGEIPPRIVMIRNHRFTIDAELWELPAGTLEKGEDPAYCAARELEEETGYHARNIIPLGTFLTTPGMTDEVMHAYAATGLTHVGQKLEPDERIQPELVTASNVFTMLDRGELRDAKSIVTLILAQRRGLLGPTTAGVAP